MIEDIKKDASERMDKSIEALKQSLSKVRTGRAHPSLLDHLSVDYYGSQVPISQVANISVEDARTLTVTPWEKQMVQVIEKAIISSDLGLNPATAGTVMRRGWIAWRATAPSSSRPSSAAISARVTAERSSARPMFVLGRP